MDDPEPPTLLGRRHRDGGAVAMERQGPQERRWGVGEGALGGGLSDDPLLLALIDAGPD